MPLPVYQGPCHVRTDVTKPRRQIKKANSHGPAGAIKQEKFPLCGEIRSALRNRRLPMDYDGKANFCANIPTNC